MVIKSIMKIELNINHEKFFKKVGEPIRINPSETRIGLEQWDQKKECLICGKIITVAADCSMMGGGWNTETGLAKHFETHLAGKIMERVETILPKALNKI